MQLAFDFSKWLISPRQGVVGRQYDNLSHSLVVEGELPSGYTWDMLIDGLTSAASHSHTATGNTGSASGYTGYTGSGNSHNHGNTGNALETKSILSPYQTFYVWERIA